MNRFIKLLIFLLFAAIPAYGQALWNGFQPQQTASNPLQLRVADGDLSSVLGISTFLSKNLTMAANDTTYVYLDLTTIPPILSQNTTGFPTSQAYTIAIVTTNASKITNVVDARPPWNTLLFGGSGIVNVTNPPTGFCTSGVPPEQVISSGAIYTCQFNQWGQISGAQGMTFCGNWSATQSYALNCVVIFNNTSYVSLVANTGQSPLNITFWQPLANPVQNGIIAGCGVNWTSGYNFTVGACEYGIQNTIYNSPLTNITLAAADPSLDRIDTIYVDTTGSVAVLTGTPSANPTPPTVDPLTQLALSFVYVTANTTQPSQISTEVIYAENTSPPEWACTVSANLNCASTNNPYAGTKDIEATTAVTGNNVTFVKPAAGTEDLSTWDTLFFYIRSKAAWPSGSSISVQWYNASTPVGNPVVLRDGQFGFNSVTSSIYQQVAIAASLFGTGSNVVTTLKMTVTSTTNIGFYADNVILQRGQTNLNLPTGIMIFRGTWNSSIAYNTFDVVTSGCGTGTCSYVALSANTNTSVATGTVWRPLSSVNGIATCTINGVAYYNSTTGLTCVTPPSVNGNYRVGYTVTASAAVPPATQLDGLTQNAVSGATSTFTVATAHCGGQVITHDVAGSQSVAVTLPTATTLLNASCAFAWVNKSSHDDTITPTTWTVDGSASLVVKAGASCLLSVDKVSATNWLSDCHAIGTTGGGGGITQAYQTIENNATALTQRSTVNFIAAGSANFVCVDNSGSTRTDCTVTGINGPPSPAINTQTAGYTINNGDNAARLVFTGTGGYSVTLPQAGQISAAPFVAQRYAAASGGCTTCTTSAFAQSAGHTLVVTFSGQGNNTLGTTSVTDTAGDTFTVYPQQISVFNDYMMMARADNIAASASNVVTINMTGSINFGRITVLEYSTIAFDHQGQAVNTAGASDAVTTVPVSYGTELIVGLGSGQAVGSGSCPTGWTQRDAATNGVLCDRIANSVSSVVFSIHGNGEGSMAFSYGIAGNATFTQGWYVVIENDSLADITINPQTSTINLYGGPSNATTLIMPRGQWCSIMSDGTNYDAYCGGLVYSRPGRVHLTGRTASVSTATLCDAVSGGCDQAGQYHVHFDFFETGTACSNVTAGSVAFNLTWTDANSVTHSAVVIPMLNQTGATSVAQGNAFTFATALANAGASGDFNITTNGTIIQYSTTYTACTTGTGTYNLDAAVTRIQ